ncbi:MAG: serine/threonine protein kinase [Acidobacteria bacterium]|nr:serine/threonine protein kinase [Acidobacteriota bacterium]
MVGDPLLGRVIDGRYRIEAEIGAGGMATIYRATRLQIGDAVAVKVLRSELLREPQFAERFRREAQAAARLKHPNVVAIYDFGVSAEGVIYLVMELIEGSNLRTIIKDSAPMPSALAAEIVRQVCAALSEAHRNEIVHRDIKPANIAVQSTPDGPRVKVLDFGIARLQAGSPATFTRTGAVLGTPAYMSPEQCLGEQLDARSDIYSLGVVLFEMLCGVVPFNSPTATAVVMQHLQQAPPPLRVLNASISQAVEAVVLKALAKRREERFQSARDLADAFTSATVGPRIALGRETVAAPRAMAPQLDATLLQVPAPAAPRQRRVGANALAIAIGAGSAAVVAFGVFAFQAFFFARQHADSPTRPVPGPSRARAVRESSAVSVLQPGAWRIEEDNIQVGTIIWSGTAIRPPGNGDVEVNVRKERIAGRNASLCERETTLRAVIKQRPPPQSVPYREVNCFGAASNGEMRVTEISSDGRSFSGNFWLKGANVGDFIAVRR